LLKWCEMEAVREAQRRDGSIVNKLGNRVLGVAAAFLWMLQAVAVSAQPGTAALHGVVLSDESGKPISDVNLALINVASGEKQQGTTSDGDGRFIITGVVAGGYQLRATRIGFDMLIREDVTIEPGLDLHLELSMSPAAFRLREITVTPGSFAFMETESATRQIMSRADIESVPQFGEDIFRAVNRLPRLSAGDYSAQFSIRGGRQDETLILIDGLEIYEPYI
jgi:hypothetical protein